MSIQQNVIGNIVKPILSSIQIFLKNNLSLNFEQELLLNSLYKNVENPFRECDTEYKLQEWLKSKKYMSNFEMFSINTEIGPVFQRGEINYDEVETTGVLLPISFQFQQVFEKK